MKLRIKLDFASLLVFDCMKEEGGWTRAGRRIPWGRGEVALRRGKETVLAFVAPLAVAPPGSC